MVIEGKLRLWSLSAFALRDRRFVPVKKLTDYVVFHDHDLGVRYSDGKIPMTTLFEAYLDGAVDIPDIDVFLDGRADLVNYTLTKHHFEFLFTRFIPEVAIHSKAQ